MRPWPCYSAVHACPLVSEAAGRPRAGSQAPAAAPAKVAAGAQMTSSRPPLPFPVQLLCSATWPAHGGCSRVSVGRQRCAVSIKRHKRQQLLHGARVLFLLATSAGSILLAKLRSLRTLPHTSCAVPRCYVGLRRLDKALTDMPGVQAEKEWCAEGLWPGAVHWLAACQGSMTGQHCRGVECATSAPLKPAGMHFH